MEAWCTSAGIAQTDILEGFSGRQCSAGSDTLHTYSGLILKKTVKNDSIIGQIYGNGEIWRTLDDFIKGLEMVVCRLKLPRSQAKKVFVTKLLRLVLGNETKIGEKMVLKHMDGNKLYFEGLEVTVPLSKFDKNVQDKMHKITR